MNRKTFIKAIFGDSEALQELEEMIVDRWNGNPEINFSYADLDNFPDEVSLTFWDNDNTFTEVFSFPLKNGIIEFEGEQISILPD